MTSVQPSGVLMLIETRSETDCNLAVVNVINGDILESHQFVVTNGFLAEGYALGIVSLVKQYNPDKIIMSETKGKLLNEFREKFNSELASIGIQVDSFGTVDYIGVEQVEDPEVFNTDLMVILDESGSMLSIKDEVIKNFNSFIDEQKNIEGNILNKHLVLFNSEVKYVGEVDELDNTTYLPRGMTAMYDGIGVGIEKLNEAKSKAYVKADSTIVVIITDGLENRSTDYNLDSIKTLIAEKEKEGWNFIFLGANIDSFGIGGGMGVDAQSIRSYTNNGDLAKSAFLDANILTTQIIKGNLNGKDLV